MKQDVRNGNCSGNKILERLAAEKKKAGIAACLIAVMAIMWVKVLTREGPASAPAAPAANQTQTGKQAVQAARVSYIDLPNVPGRNDSISKDFFASVRWQGFETDGTGNDAGGVEAVVTAVTDQSQEIVAAMTKHLRLQAVGRETDKEPQAYISDKLVSVSDTLTVKEGAQTYECEVAEIGKNSVLIRCREAEVVLKLVQPNEGDG